MTISYENKFRDLVVFNFHTMIRSPVSLVCWGTVLVLLCQVAYQATEHHTTEVRVVATIAMAGLVLLVFLILDGVMAILTIISRKNRTFLTRHTLTFTEDFLIEETEFNRTETKWTGIQKVLRKRNYLYIYVAQYSAHLIPRRAVPDPDWDIIYDFCVGKLAANKPSR